jgi:C-terminal processing protease CtpA/Prc
MNTKKLLTTFLLLFFAFILRGQEKKEFPADNDKEFDKGSKISTITIDKNKIENLKALGLIWGFVKYYHPNIAKGAFNWDYELFRVLPLVLHAENTKARDELLITWIEKLGSFSEGKEVKVKSKGIKFGPDLDWIDISGFSPSLRTLLSRIKNADRSKEHYYIELRQGVFNPNFRNEKSHVSMPYPDAGIRLLALYRYWNMIQYYYPYKNLIEEDWKKVLEEFIPKVTAAKDETEYTLSMLELIARVHDTHANIWGINPVLDKYLGLRYAPAELQFVENQAVVIGYFDGQKSKESGLEIGDVITGINNQSIDEIIKGKLKYTPASNYPTQLRNMARNLLRSNDSAISVEFVRMGKKERVSLKTFSPTEIGIYDSYQNTDTSFKIINNNIAYINNGSLKNAYLPKIWKDVQNTKGLIIDIRNYPSDFPVVYNLSSYLMPRSIPFAKITYGSIETPGLFSFSNSIRTGNSNRDYYKGKVVILINEKSQSAAEFHAMAYRVHPNAVVIGSTTAGADGDVSPIELPGGISTGISGIGVYYPDGKETQRIGIVPDIEIKPTIKGIKEGRDELMEKAIEVINGR